MGGRGAPLARRGEGLVGRRCRGGPL